MSLQLKRILHNEDLGIELELRSVLIEYIEVITTVECYLGQ